MKVCSWSHQEAQCDGCWTSTRPHFYVSGGGGLLKKRWWRKGDGRADISVITGFRQGKPDWGEGPDTWSGELPPSGQPQPKAASPTGKAVRFHVTASKHSREFQLHLLLEKMSGEKRLPIATWSFVFLFFSDPPSRWCPSQKRLLFHSKLQIEIPKSADHKQIQTPAVYLHLFGHNNQAAVAHHFLPFHAL